MSDGLSGKPRVAVIATGVANLASMLAALERAGAEAFATRDPELVAASPYALLPGVGAFGPAAETLRASGVDRALRARWRARLPTLGVCLGMQLFFEGSEESPGTPGLAIVPGIFRGFAGGLPLPQLGWNRVTHSIGRGGASPAGCGSVLADGWAYFANSYRLASPPPGCVAYRAEYGEGFVAGLEAGRSARGGPVLALCQFHPELSGSWGLALLRRWLGLEAGGAP